MFSLGFVVRIEAIDEEEEMGEACDAALNLIDVLLQKNHRPALSLSKKKTNANEIIFKFLMILNLNGHNF